MPNAVRSFHIRELLGDNGLGMFDCTIRAEEQVRATARISVYEPEDGSAYVRALQTTEG